MTFRDRCPRLSNVCRSLRGESLLTIDEYLAATAALRRQRDEAVKERDEARTRYETLVAECTRHRHATWEITHK